MASIKVLSGLVAAFTLIFPLPTFAQATGKRILITPSPLLCRRTACSSRSCADLFSVHVKKCYGPFKKTIVKQDYAELGQAMCDCAIAIIRMSPRLVPTARSFVGNLPQE